MNSSLSTSGSDLTQPMWHYAYLEEQADPDGKQEAPWIFPHQPGPRPAIDVQGKKTAPPRKGSATAPNAAPRIAI